MKEDNVFRNKNFVLVFLGALVSNIGATLYTFAVGFYILLLTNNNSFTQGLYLAACGITFCIFSLIGGVLGDRLNDAKIMYICDYAKGLLILVTALLVYIYRNNNGVQLVFLFVAGIVGNIIGAIFSPASGSLLPKIVKEERLQQANSYFSILSSFQSIAGVILAGILYAFIPINVLFMIVGICYVGSAISEMFIKYDYVKKDTKITIKWAFNDLKSGFKYLSSQKSIMVLLLICLVINFFFSPVFDNFSPYFIETDISGHSYLFDSFITPEMFSSIFSVSFGICSIIAGTIMSKKQQKARCGKNLKRLMICQSLLFVALTIGYYFFIFKEYSLNAFIIEMTILLGLLGAFLVFVNIPINTTLQIKIAREQFGKSQGVMNLLTQGLIPLSSFLAGIILQQFGSLGLLIFCTIGIIGITTYMQFNQRLNEI